MDKTLNKNNAYTPTLKDIKGFEDFRADVTLYDNYLLIGLIVILIVHSIRMWLVTQSVQIFTLNITIPVGIAVIIYAFFIAPRYPFKISEIENCSKGIVLEKKMASKNAIRQNYYGKKYYFLKVLDLINGYEYENVRVLKDAYEQLNNGDNVICFDYKRESMLLSGKAAIIDKN